MKSYVLLFILSSIMFIDGSELEMIWRTIFC